MRACCFASSFITPDSVVFSGTAGCDRWRVVAIGKLNDWALGHADLEKWLV